MNTFVVVNLSKPKVVMRNYFEEIISNVKFREHKIDKKNAFVTSLIFFKAALNSSAAQGCELAEAVQLNADTYDNNSELALFMLGEALRQINIIGFTPWINCTLTWLKENK